LYHFGSQERKQNTNMLTKRLVIYWQNDSSELLSFLKDAGDPGQTAGNDGCEIAVTDTEYMRIMDVAPSHPAITIEEYDGDHEELQQAVDDWYDLTH
jgi:hypothetical protein